MTREKVPLELKRLRGGRLSKERDRWIDGLTHQGYCVRVPRGWEQAAQSILWYLNIGSNRDD